MEDELQRIDEELRKIGESSLDKTQFAKLIQLILERIQLSEDDRTLKPFSVTIKVLGLNDDYENKLLWLRNSVVHDVEGADTAIKDNEDWIRHKLIPSVLKMDVGRLNLKNKIVLRLQNICNEYGYSIEVGKTIAIGPSIYLIDAIFESKEIRAIGEIKESETPGARATGIRQLEVYMTGMDIDYGILIHGNHDSYEEMEYQDRHIFTIGTSADLSKIFEWLDTQVSYIRRGLKYEIFDWSGKDFELGKKLALYWIEILEKIARGEHVNREETLVEYARNELGVELSTEAVEELYQIGGDSQGFFYRMGFDGRESSWVSLPQELALNRLNKERSRIENLTREAIVRRYTQMEEKEEVTLVPTSSMEFEKQVLILRAYVVLSNMGTEPVHYKRVMAVTKLARTQVSGVNAFFIGLGFLEIIEKGTYLPVKEVVKFYSETLGQEDYSALQPVLRTSGLYDRIRSLILIHGIATEDDLIDYLLEESGETTKSRAKRALDWLERTCLIEIKDDGEVQLVR